MSRYHTDKITHGIRIRRRPRPRQHKPSTPRRDSQEHTGRRGTNCKNKRNQRDTMRCEYYYICTYTYTYTYTQRRVLTILPSPKPSTPWVSQVAPQARLQFTSKLPYDRHQTYVCNLPCEYVLCCVCGCDGCLDGCCVCVVCVFRVCSCLARRTGLQELRPKGPMD